jgi:hypothetical protein
MSALLRSFVLAGVTGWFLAAGGMASAGSDAPNGQVGLDWQNQGRRDARVYPTPPPGSRGAYEPYRSYDSDRRGPNRYPDSYSDWDRDRYDDDDYRDRRGRKLERNHEREKRDIEEIQAEERKDVERKQKQERKVLKSTGEWGKDDKRRQKQERKVLQKDQKNEDRELQRDQRDDWRDYWHRRRD